MAAKAEEAGTIADEDAEMADADSETTPRKSGRKVKPTEKVLEVRFRYLLIILIIGLFILLSPKT